MGLFGFYFVYRYKKGGFEQIAQEILHHTESEASRRRAEFDIQLKQKEFDHRQSLERVSEQKMQKLALREEKLDPHSVSISLLNCLTSMFLASVEEIPARDSSCIKFSIFSDSSSLSF